MKKVRIMVARKEKNIEIIANEKMDHGTLLTEYVVGEDVIGRVLPVDGAFQAELPDGRQFKLPSEDEAVDALIREYHLHH